MSKVVACYKWVIDEADIRIKPDLSIDTSRAKWKISDYDKNAIEAAAQAAKELGGEAVTLTFGGANAKQSIKDALSRGMQDGYWIQSELAASADGSITAKALGAAIAKIDDVSLVVCAEGSSDIYARQTASRIGAVLDWPVVTSVSQFVINGNTLKAQRRLEDCIETVTVEFPAVIAVLPEINDPPLPTLKAVMAAGKKKVVEFTDDLLGLTAVQAKATSLSLKPYVMERKRMISKDGDAAQKVTELVTNLKKAGVL